MAIEPRLLSRSVPSKITDWLKIRCVDTAYQSEIFEPTVKKSLVYLLILGDLKVNDDQSAGKVSCFSEAQIRAMNLTLFFRAPLPQHLEFREHRL